MSTLNSIIYKIAKSLTLFLRLFRVLKNTVSLYSLSVLNRTHFIAVNLPQSDLISDLN